jgi:hypothetical protein
MYLFFFFLMSHKSSELMCREDPNGTTLQGVCETSEIGGMGRWWCGDMRLKGVATRWLVACLEDLMMLLATSVVNGVFGLLGGRMGCLGIDRNTGIG